jgi:hypothetical protein
MGEGIMHIIEVEFSPELRIRRTSEEIKAAVESQKGISLFNHLPDGCKNEYIVKAFVLCKIP